MTHHIYSLKNSSDCIAIFPNIGLLMGAVQIYNFAAQPYIKGGVGCNSIKMLSESQLYISVPNATLLYYNELLLATLNIV